MMTYPVTVTVLGCRGSIPVSGDQFSRFGGATCCVFVRAENAIAVLDAGTGLLNLSQHLRGETDIPIFITHCHADHILGIPMCQPALTPGQQICIYGAVHEDMDIAAQIGKLVAPPLWPVSTHQLPSEITYRAVEPQLALALDGLVVESMEGCHPGGVTVYRLTIGGRRIVYMTDCTITDANYDALLSFCRDCDLLLCDGQYSDAQWSSRAAFGHNCWTSVAHFGKACGAGAVRILHHDPTHTDDILAAAQLEVQKIDPACALAFEGEEIIL